MSYDQRWGWGELVSYYQNWGVDGACVLESELRGWFAYVLGPELGLGCACVL